MTVIPTAAERILQSLGVVHPQDIDLELLHGRKARSSTTGRSRAAMPESSARRAKRSSRSTAAARSGVGVSRSPMSSAIGTITAVGSYFATPANRKFRRIGY